MAVALVASTSSGVTDSQSTSKATNVPAGAASGHVAVLMLEMWQSTATNPTVTWPSGFTEVANYVSTTDGFQKVKVALKVLTGADSGTYTASWTGTHWNQLQCALFSGVDNTTPLDVAVNTAQNSTGTGLPANSLTTANAGCGVLRVLANENSATLSTVDTGYTKPTNGEANYLKHEYKIAGAAGTETPSGGALSASTLKLGVLLALRPASSGATMNMDAATGTGTPQAMSFTKALALGAASGTGSPQAGTFTEVPTLGPAAGTGTAQSLSASKGLTLGPAAGTGTPQAMSFTKDLALGTATGSGAPAAIAVGKAPVLGPAAGTGAPQALAPGKDLSLQNATGSGAAQAVSLTPAGGMTLGPATGTGSPQAMTFAKAWALGAATGAGTPQTLTNGKALSFGAAAGSGAARQLALTKQWVFGAAQGAGTAYELAWSGPLPDYEAPDHWTITTRNGIVIAPRAGSFTARTRVARYSATTRKA